MENYINFKINYQNLFQTTKPPSLCENNKKEVSKRLNSPKINFFFCCYKKTME